MSGKLIARSKSVRVNSKKKTKEEIIAALRSDAVSIKVFEQSWVEDFVA